MIPLPMGNRRTRGTTPKADHYWARHCARLSRYLHCHCGWRKAPHISGYHTADLGPFAPHTAYGYAYGYADKVLRHPPPPPTAKPGLVLDLYRYTHLIAKAPANSFALDDLALSIRFNLTLPR